jgi:hypothetical protein
MLFGKKTKIYAPNISADVKANADVDAKMKKGGEKGAKALMAALKKQGYKNGGEQKLLMKAGGMLDFAEMAADKMRYGAEKYGYVGSKKKMKLGGTSGKSTYSGSKKGRR